MAFGAVKSLVVSGASSLLRISGAQRRTSSSQFATFISAAGRTCDECLGKERRWLGFGFRSYATQTLSSVGDRKGFSPRRTRRGGARVESGGTPRSPLAAAAAASASKGQAVAAVTEEQELEEEGEGEEEEEEWRSRNQSKRDAKRARQWGHELAGLAPAQLKQAVRWAGLSEDVYDSVMIVKNLGTRSQVRNGRRRQYNYIGGLLRDVDPKIMEPVLKATKDGDVESIMFNSPVLPDPADLDDKESWAEAEVEVEDDEGSPKHVAEEWMRGLINGIPTIEDEVYSIYDVDYDRQELRKLVRSAQQFTVAESSAESSATAEPTREDGLDAPGTLSAKEAKSQEMLRKFLINIAEQRPENQCFSML